MIRRNNGLDKYIRAQLKKVFPKIELKEIPFSHAIFNQTFTFNKGLPKIHEHNKKVPQGFDKIENTTTPKSNPNPGFEN